MKKIILLASLAFSINAFAQIPTNGLTSYWLFTGNANDNSGIGNNGTVTGATLTTDRFGNSNSAYNFTGTAQYITTTYPGITGTNDRTFSLWFKQSSLNNGSDEWPLFSYGGTLQGSGLGAMIFPTNNAIGIDIGNSYVTFSPIPALNQWHHLAVTYSSTFGTNVLACKVYLDNVLLSTINTQYNSTLTINTGTGTNLFIGGNQSFAPQQFLGAIDDFRAYNTVLNQSEIGALYNEGICYTNITVTDTLLINTTLTSLNPVTYQNTIKVWPNPTNDHITIDNGNITNLTGYQIKITNSLSQQVFQSAITQQQFYVDLSAWTGNGIYFVHIIDGQGNTIDIKKIVLQ